MTYLGGFSSGTGARRAAAGAGPDLLRLNGIAVDCILGDLPAERTTAQRILVDVELGFDATPAALSADLARTIDYARLEREIRFILAESHFHLVESAAYALVQWLLLPPLSTEPSATRARVSLEKPTALGGGAVPAIVVERRVGDFTVRTGAQATDKEITAFTCPDAAIYRLHGNPAVWPKANAIVYATTKDSSFFAGTTVRVSRR